MPRKTQKKQGAESAGTTGETDHPVVGAGIGVGAAGSVMPVETMAGEITAPAKRASHEEHESRTASTELDPNLRAILDILRIKVGHDFRCYKPNTLVRRVHRRMSLGKIETLADYARFLGENIDEVGRLQKDLQIGVTEFFRQPQAWEILEEKVIIPLVEAAQPGSEIRIWVPGCATGQEAYSLTMMLAEQREKTGKDISIQVFATDSDIASLSIARTGTYTEEDIGGGVPSRYVKRFFTRKDSRFQIIKTIRERIVFAPQNITADPPFSRMDLISCRNLLMYIDQRVQQKIFDIFHFALREGGFLFLGSAETIGERTDLFEPVSKKWRIYRRFGVGRSVGIEIPVRPIGVFQRPHTKIPVVPFAPRITLGSTAQQVLMDRFAPACVMIDRTLRVLYVHGTVDEYLTFPAGELTMHVANMAREGLRARLRMAIAKCVETGRIMSITARVRRGGKTVPVKATVSPLRFPRSTDGLLLVTFEDQHLPATKLPRHVAEDSETRQLEDELKITREELQSTIEQLEGSNDLLKAANEEVTAANEELQAVNEELETSKEELQSLNEELNTSNTRLHEKVDELENTNNDIVNLLSSTAIATLFLDKELRIKRFTPTITGLFSLIPSDADRPIANVLRRFTDETLLGDARRVLADLAPAAREIQADDGRWYMRRITPYRTQDDRIEGVVFTFVDFTELKRADDALIDARQRQAVILDSIADGFFALDRGWRFIHINDTALGHFGKERSDVMGRNLFDVFPTARGSVFEREYRHAMDTGEPVRFDAPSIIGEKALEVFAYPGPDNLTVLFRDVTEKHQTTAALAKAHERAIWLARFPEENPNPVVRATADGNVLYCNPASAAESAWRCKEGEAMPDVFLSLLAQAMAREEEVQQEVLLEKSYYDVTITPFPTEAYTNIYGREITKRKQAEQAFKESEKRVRLKLESILSPEGDIGDLALGDIIDVEAIRSIMADFSALTNIAVAIIDLKGTVLVGEAWQDICTKFHRIHPEACMHCIESDTQLTTGVPPGESRLYKCKNNMWDIATPIMVGGQHVGNVFTGQFFFADEPVDYELFRAQARKYGFAEDAYMGALAAVPRLKRESVDQTMSFLIKLAQTISQLSYSNIKLARSIAERDTLMDSLRESEERLRLFIEHAPASLAMFDREMRYLSVSHRWLNDYGVGSRDLLGMSHYEVFPEIPAEWKEAHRRGLTGESLRAEADRFQRTDGSVQWVHWEIRPWYKATGTVGGIVIFTEDITQRKASEAALLTSEARLNRAQEIAHLGSWELDLVNNRLSWSDEVYRIFGLRPQEFGATYEAFLEHIHPGDRDAVDAAYHGSLRENRDDYEIEHRVIRRDTGEIRIVYERCQHFRDRSGAIIRSVGMVHDITEGKQAEASLLKNTEQLEAANKELESFTCSVSHDLRAPLRAIDGYSRMILRKHADKFDDDAFNKFNVIRKSTQMMGQLIDDLLAFSRLDRTHLSKSKLDMDVLIGEIWKDLAGNDTERHIDFRILALPPGIGDPGLIRQVLTNMLANAVKFTRVRQEAVIEVGGYVRDSESVYYVRDNGAGFDMNYYDKLFGVFQRLHHVDDFEGTGVGLALVQRIIHRHGGQVWAEGKLDEGACFYFTLPSL